MAQTNSEKIVLPTDSSTLEELKKKMELLPWRDATVGRGGQSMPHPVAVAVVVQREGGVTFSQVKDERFGLAH